MRQSQTREECYMENDDKNEGKSRFSSIPIDGTWCIYHSVIAQELKVNFI